MRDALDDHLEDYRSLNYGNWCELLSTIKVKDESKSAAVHIKKIASARAASLSDSNKSVRIPRRKKAKTSFLSSTKSPRRAHERHHRAQSYCVLCKKSGVTDFKYASHSSEDCTGMRTKRPIKDGMGGPIGSRSYAVQQHNKSENKRKKYLKALSKKNKMLYIIAKKYGSRREIKNIKKTREKSCKKTSVSSSEDWDSNYSLASDSSRDKNRRPSGR